MKTIAAPTVLALLASVVLASPAAAQTMPSVCSVPRPGKPDVVSLDAAAKIGAVGDTIKLRATLKASNGSAIGGEKISFRVAGMSVGVGSTNASGVAEVSYKVPNQLGQLPIETRFFATSSCATSVDTATLGIVKSGTELKVVSASATEKDDLTFAVDASRVTDHAPLGGRAFTIVLDGKKVGTTTTDLHGRFFFKIPTPPSASASSKLEAHFEGDSLYAPSSVTAPLSFTTAITTSWFHTDSATVAPGQTVLVDGWVRTDDAAFKPIVGVKVFAQLEVTGDPYRVAKLGEAYTEEDGKVRIPITLADNAIDSWLSLASIHVRAYKSDVKIVKSSVGQIRVVAARTSLTVASAPTSASIGQTVSYKVRLVRTTDGAGIKGATVTSDMGSTAKTDETGWATFSTVVPGGSAPGVRKVNISFGKQPFYVDSATSFSLDVRPNAS